MSRQAITRTIRSAAPPLIAFAAGAAVVTAMRRRRRHSPPAEARVRSLAPWRAGGPGLVIWPKRPARRLSPDELVMLAPCPGGAEYGHGFSRTVVHAGGCCARRGAGGA
jgi:hypothetical protein